MSWIEVHRQTGFALLNSPTPAETRIVPVTGLLHAAGFANVISPESRAVELTYHWLDGSVIWDSGTDRGTISIGLWTSDTSTGVSTLTVINDSQPEASLPSSRPTVINIPKKSEVLGIYISAIVNPADPDADGLIVYAREVTP